MNMRGLEAVDMWKALKIIDLIEFLPKKITYETNKNKTNYKEITLEV